MNEDKQQIDFIDSFFRDEQEMINYARACFVVNNQSLFIKNSFDQWAIKALQIVLKDRSTYVV